MMTPEQKLVFKFQKKVFEIVTKDYSHYGLTGGTALAFYFNHRFSEDLDFFTQKYRDDEPEEIMETLKQKTGCDWELTATHNEPGQAVLKMVFMEIPDMDTTLKIDFVEDFLELREPKKKGLYSITDIYIRKLLAATGVRIEKNKMGMPVATGRQASKDFYDIYYLSSNAQALSEFFDIFFSKMKDANARLFSWHRSFNRMELIGDLLDLVPGVDAKEVIYHLDTEIEKIARSLY